MLYGSSFQEVNGKNDLAYNVNYLNYGKTSSGAPEFPGRFSFRFSFVFPSSCHKVSPIDLLFLIARLIAAIGY